MTNLRRFLVIQSLLAWQGGFFFYATVVVPVGTSVLESASLQGAITQRVTNWLNGFGAIALALLLLDQLRVKPFRRSRWVVWAILVFSHLVLVFLHPWLDALLIAYDAESMFVPGRPTFKYWHGVYLWTSAVQWLAALVSVWFTLRAWHVESKGTS